MENLLLYFILIIGTLMLNWDILNEPREQSVPKEE